MEEEKPSKYPPPHPDFLKEHQDTVDHLRQAKAKVKMMEERLFAANVSLDRLRRAVNGGATDPWSDDRHPGHVLLLLGWEHHADDDGLCWKDPVMENGKPVYRTLPEALGLACRRLMDRASTVPPALTRLLEEDDDL